MPVKKKKKNVVNTKYAFTIPNGYQGNQKLLSCA